MKSKTKLLAIAAALPIIGASLLGAGVASAHGLFGPSLTAEEMATRQQTMFQSQASLLGVSVDEVKASWASGQTFEELAVSKGLTQAQLREKMKAARLAEMKAQLASLVSKGVITQAQADSRLAFMTANEGKMGKGMRGGRGGLFGF
jgi:uncharacterized protein YaiL (DUF2058 family)